MSGKLSSNYSLFIGSIESSFSSSASASSTVFISTASLLYNFTASDERGDITGSDYGSLEEAAGCRRPLALRFARISASHAFAAAYRAWKSGRVDNATLACCC